MRVQDALEYLSETTRQAILTEQSQRFGLAEGQELHNRLLDPSFLKAVWNQASEPEREVIKLFVTQSARGFFSKKSWERATAEGSRHLSIGLTKLRRLGLVLTVRKMWSEIGYVMPQEVREQFTVCMLLEPDWAEISSSKTLPYYISPGRGIHLDLFGLLLFVRDHQVPLTQKGSIHRRYWQKMRQRLSIADSHVSGLVLPPLDQEEREGLSLTVALDIGMRLGLIRIKKRFLVLDSARVRQWLALSAPARWDEMYPLVVEHYLPHEGWWDAFATMMRQVPLDQWCSLAEQLRKLEDGGFSLPLQAAEQIREQWLHLLCGLGWIQLGVDGGDRLFWRWTSLPRMTQEEGWYIDPAGTITMPPLVRSRLRGR